MWLKHWREWGRRGGGAKRVWLVHSQPAAASESVMSPEATEAQAPEVKVQLGLWALGGGTCFAPSLSLSSTARLSLQLGFARGARWNPPVGIEHELPALRESAAAARRVDIYFGV